MKYGCPRCGGTESKVRLVEHDEEAVPVRIRLCTRLGCRGRWATEERAISINAFHARRHTDHDRRRRAYRLLTNVCTHCHLRYRRGHYMQHCRTDRHKAALLHPLPESRRAADRLRKRKKYQPSVLREAA